MITLNEQKNFRSLRDEVAHVFGLYCSEPNFDDILEKYPDDEFLKERISVLSSIDNRD